MVDDCPGLGEAGHSLPVIQHRPLLQVVQAAWSVNEGMGANEEIIVTISETMLPVCKHSQYENSIVHIILSRNAFWEGGRNAW